jgi:hypothetical protein
LERSYDDFSLLRDVDRDLRIRASELGIQIDGLSPYCRLRAIEQIMRAGPWPASWVELVELIYCRDPWLSAFIRSRSPHLARRGGLNWDSIELNVKCNIVFRVIACAGRWLAQAQIGEEVVSHG